MSLKTPAVEVCFFSGKDCTVCHALEPKVKDLLKEKFPPVSYRSIDIKEEVVLAAQYSVFTLPVLLILIDGKEQNRFVRSFSVSEVEEKLNRITDLIF